MTRAFEHLRSWLIAAAICLVVFSTPSIAADDSSWLIGEWAGTAAGAPGGPRQIIISAVKPDGQVTGGFGVATTIKPGNATASFKDGQLDILTATGNGARLMRSGDQLVGKLIVNNDKTFDVTFTRTSSNLAKPGIVLAQPVAIQKQPPTIGQSLAIFRRDGMDAADFGIAEGYPIGTIGNWIQPRYLVGSFSHFDDMTTWRRIIASPQPAQLQYGAQTPALAKSMQSYLASNPATGVIVLRGDEILFEQYQYGRTDKDRFTAWSMTKTVTAMLIGIALQEGRLRSIDDTAETYVPALTGTEYGKTKLRHLLTMSSGVAFREDGNDQTKLFIVTVAQAGPGGAAAVTQFNHREVPAGTKFRYASAETQVLGLVLSAVAGMPVSQYMSQQIWRPMGAEADATWAIDKSGQETSYCCFNAVLRDYARFGLLLARDGKGPDGKQLIPAEWVQAATTVRPDDRYLRPGSAMSFFGYGFQTRVFPGSRRMFFLSGAHGQAIFVDPASRTVLVHTAVRKTQSNPDNPAIIALWYGVLESLGVDRSKPN